MNLRSITFLLLGLLLLSFLAFGKFYLSFHAQKLRPGAIYPIKIPKPKVFLPSPLEKTEERETVLSEEGIIEFTNLEREKRNLPPLKRNQLLDLSAKLKVEDMFKNQYFGHESPQGIDFQYLIKKVGYQCLECGENLAMGYFENDQKLVEGWMSSPGHRKNILNEHYKEIGVAVKKGVYKNKEIWMAVQHFGRPLSDCEKPNETLKEEVEKNQAQLESLKERLKSLKTEIEAGKRELIQEYNKISQEYNSLLDRTKILIDIYNEQVVKFNECVAK